MPKNYMQAFEEWFLDVLAQYRAEGDQDAFVAAVKRAILKSYQRAKESKAVYSNTS